MKVLIKNRQGYYQYQILSNYVAGIQLMGSEVKSIRLSNVSINEAYCFFRNGELFIKNMHIAPYSFGDNTNTHEPLREKKLLMNKKEILSLAQKIKEKGLTLIPLNVLLSDIGLIKIELGLAKGKNVKDKKDSIKEKDIQRDIKRNLD